MAGTTIGNAYVQIVPSAQGIQGKITNALNGEVTAAGKTGGAKLSGMLGAALKTGGALIGIATVGNAVKGLITEINNTNTSWTNFASNMQMAGMSNKGINAAKKDLQDFAAKTIYSSKDMAATYAQLYAVNNKTTTAMVKGFGAVAAASDNPKQAMQSISMQATQMMAKPTVAWQDFKIMLEQSPAGISQVAKAMGMSTKELVQNVQDGTIKTEEFLGAMEKIGKNDNGGLMKMAQSYKTIGQAADGLTATIATKLAPGFKVISDAGIQGIVKLTSGVSSFMEIATNAFKGVGSSVVDAFSAIGNVFGQFSGFASDTGLLEGALRLLGDAITIVCDGITGIATATSSVIEYFKQHKTATLLLATACGTLTTAIIALNAAKIASAIASGAETVAIAALCAWDVIATAATGALAAATALLAAPFTPVILAIGALIAIGILLYKNWDTICKKSKADIEAWKQVFINFKNSVVSIWNSIKSATASAWNAIKSAITTPVTNAVNTVKTLINKVKGFFPIKVGNLLSGIKLPHFKITGSFSIKNKTVPKLSIDWYKTGGIFDSPTIAGIGEAGPEAVVPLDTLWSKLDAMAMNTLAGMQMIAANIGNGGDVTVQTYLYPNGQIMDEQVFKSYERGKKSLRG